MASTRAVWSRRRGEGRRVRSSLMIRGVRRRSLGADHLLGVDGCGHPPRRDACVQSRRRQADCGSPPDALPMGRAAGRGFGSAPPALPPRKMGGDTDRISPSCAVKGTGAVGAEDLPQLGDQNSVLPAASPPSSDGSHSSSLMVRSQYTARSAGLSATDACLIHHGAGSRSTRHGVNAKSATGAVLGQIGTSATGQQGKKVRLQARGTFFTENGMPDTP